ncbi:IS66 family transposase [Microbulbifer okhotskensis]
MQRDVLHFMENQDTPYTNNQGERDLRMAKVQQKISDCFYSTKGG